MLAKMPDGLKDDSDVRDWFDAMERALDGVPLPEAATYYESRIVGDGVKGGWQGFSVNPPLGCGSAPRYQLINIASACYNYSIMGP